MNADKIHSNQTKKWDRERKDSRPLIFRMSTLNPDGPRSTGFT